MKSNNFALGLLSALLIGIAVGAFVKLSTDVPQVYYSVGSGKPVYMEIEGEKTMVMPGTRIPSRHERVWVP